MKPFTLYLVAGCVLSTLFVAAGCSRSKAPQPLPRQSAALEHLLGDKELQDVGKLIFFDTELSTPPGQACAVCHGPEVGWTGPDEALNRKGAVYAGAVAERFGNRKPNSSAYATFTPVFHAVDEEGELIFVGGDFWDGRATGWKLGNPAADQAQGPFLNPVEQNNPDARSVVDKVCTSAYARDLQKVVKRLWGVDDLRNADPEFAYGIIALAVAAYEHSDEVNPFSSKYDLYLRGKATLTPEEQRGLELFEGKGRCAGCHPNRTGPNGEPPLFTDFAYDNLGFPRNPDNPWYTMPREINPDGEAWIDEGLGAFLRTLPQFAIYSRQNLGKHRAPTLRNVDLRPSPSFVKAFGHNGYFKSLEAVVHFYNTRDVLPEAGSVTHPVAGVNSWPAPEVRENLNTAEMGNLGLTSGEEAAIVAFLKTLSDGYEDAE
jgi:cytochrome c peroxidase